jgi:hypothetical protein
MLAAANLHAQMGNLHGDDNESRMGTHSGNRFRTTFFNDGTDGGRINQPHQIAGEWPINSGHFYLVDGNVFIGSEVIDNTGRLIHILSENKSVNIGGSCGDRDPVSGAWWTFLPLPGFANPDSNMIAMSHRPASWPPFWPDIADTANPNHSVDGWAGSWNGYFGRDRFNAAEESYFVADDYMNREFNFYPDSTDLFRRGLGIRMYVRGLQWSTNVVEDVLFKIFNFENIGTYTHNKMVLGYKIGNTMGESYTGSDAGDDCGSFNRELDLAYLWDLDDTGAGYWPVGYFGAAILESPGVPDDGIDNDNDGASGSGGIISDLLWQPKTLNLNDTIVVINYDNFQRHITTLNDTLTNPEDTLEIHGNSTVHKFWAGQVLNYGGMSEIGDNLFDDNLNGVIDENRGQENESGILNYLYAGYKYIDYLNPDMNANGTSNLMIDECRDDGIDNDGDWDPLLDDLGNDGIANTSDPGEGDGLPTSGEPNFDKTDLDETDMLGLTGFHLYEWASLNQYDDESYWNAMAPGFYSTITSGQNIELLFGSGYFSMKPGQFQKFAMALIPGADWNDLLTNLSYAALAYKKNFTFPLTHIKNGGAGILQNYSLQQNYPNPFNPGTTIEFVLPTSGKATLKIYNLLGQVVEILVAEKLAVGKHVYNWNATNFPSGMYFYRLESSEFVKTKKMLLLK